MGSVDAALNPGMSAETSTTNISTQDTAASVSGSKRLTWIKAFALSSDELSADRSSPMTQPAAPSASPP